MSQIDRVPELTFVEPPKLAPRGTLVVVPGRGEGPEVYRRFGTRIASDGYRVHVVADPTVDERVTRERITALAATAPRPLILLGADTGSLFAVQLAGSEPAGAFDGLVLAGLPDPEQSDDAASWSEELDARTMCPTHRARISDGLITPGALFDPLPPSWYDSGMIARLGHPILAIHGRDDSISPVEVAREMCATGPRIEFVSVAGARHDVLNDQSHRTTAAIILLWLERLRASSELALIAYHETLAVNAA